MQAGPSIVLLATLLATSASAQIGIGRINNSNLPGGALLPQGSIDITATIIATFGDDGTGMDDLRGVTRLPNGHYLISHGPAGGTNLKRYFEFDAGGTFLNQVVQPFVAGGSGIGITGLTWDQDTGPNSRVWGGRAKGIMSYNWQAQAFDSGPTGGVIIPGSANGLHLLQNWQGADIRTAAIAMVGGLQLIITADNNRGPLGQLDTAGVNYHVMGLPLAEFPEWQPSTPSFTGILGAFDAGKDGSAWDPVSNTIWWHMDNRDENPNPNHSGSRFIEMALDGTLTGQIIQGIREVGGRALGCDMYIDAQGNRVLAYLVDAGSGSDNPLGLPSTEDLLVEMYAGFQFGTNCGGDIAFETEPFIGNVDWTLTLANAPANSPAAFLARGRAAIPPGVVLPGLLNCGVLIELPSLSIGSPVPIVGGGASFVRNLPPLTSLVGAEAAFQWLALSPTGGLPLSPSDAGTVRIGTNL